MIGKVLDGTVKHGRFALRLARSDESPNIDHWTRKGSDFLAEFTSVASREAMDRHTLRQTGESKDDV